MKRVPIVLAVVAGLAGAAACGNGGEEAVRAAAARAAEAEAADARVREEAARDREARRLAALWTYHDTVTDEGRQLTAAINSTDDVDTDGRGPRVVRLIFRDHASWGRSSYLLLQAGDFACDRGCTVRVTAGEGEPASMAGRRPPTDEAIAMFIDDVNALWQTTRSARRIRIEFPVRAGGTRLASFEVGGLDPSKLPDWDAP